MNFEVKNIDIIESTSETTGPSGRQPTHSIILNELHKETEELQNKLKLNARRLLLFETENNKLLEEKNKLFFEMQNFSEQNQIFSERNTELETENKTLETEQQLLNEKVYTLQKINASQLSEIKRFSKFHLKIQNVVKPFIIQLKNQVASLTEDLSRSEKLSRQLYLAKQEAETQLNEQIEQKQNEIRILQVEKNNLISTYEEQIHSFSKEILNLQNKNEENFKEISRLKKAVEFKNYFENELIKFKRIHETDQGQLKSLLESKTSIELKYQGLEQESAAQKIEIMKIQSSLEDKDITLEMTRRQLSERIDEVLNLTERINRLEKLNNQLSREMSQQT